VNAVILAAGCSTRLYPLTSGRPKCLLEVGGKTLLEHQLEALAACHLSEAIIVTGYLADHVSAKLVEIRERYPFPLRLVHNPLYAETNNIYSLWMAREAVRKTDFLCLHADVLFHPRMLHKAATLEEAACLVVDRELREETMKVRIEQDCIVAVGKHVREPEASGTFVGLAKFSGDGGRALFHEIEQLLGEGHKDAYFTAAIERLAVKGFPVGVCFTEGLPWIEIDVLEDLERARCDVHPTIERSLHQRCRVE